MELGIFDWFDIASVSLALAGCLIASYFDLKKGRVPNRLTGLLLASSVVLAADRIILGDTVYLANYFAGFAFGFLVGYLFWAIKAWSGGDAKMFWMLCALVPVYPDFMKGLFSEVLPPWAKTLFGLTILLNLLVLLVFRVAVWRLHYFTTKKKHEKERIVLMPYFAVAFIISLFSDMVWLLYSRL